MPDVEVIACAPGAELRVTDAVRERLAEQRAGSLMPALFLIGPEVDPGEARAEIENIELPEATGVLMRTSGSSTGTGSIVALSWDSLVASAAATAEALNGPGVWMSDLPLHHIAGFQTVVRSVLAGHEPLVVDLKDTSSVIDALAAIDCPIPIYLSVVPTQLRRILADPVLTTALRDVTFLVGGAASAPALLDEAREAGLDIVTSYGMTETCGGCVYDGRPIGDTRLIINDGRISIQGSVVAQGYVGDPGAEEFPPPAETEPRIHRTKDAGRIDDGTLTVLGRIDDAITTGGLTVMPRLIEDAIAKVSALDSIVVGIPDPEWGEATAAIVAEPTDVGRLRERVRELLGAGWQPRYVLTLAELGMGEWPMTQSGKINRRELGNLTRVYFQRGNSK